MLCSSRIELDETCPKDGAKLVRRTGRNGEFVSCSNYPKCKYIKQDTIGIKCDRDKCDGELVVKKSRFGKPFYSCSNYPKCDNVYWDLPVQTPCPECKAPMLCKKTTKREGTFLYCKTEGCEYKLPVEDSESDK